jgi:hypothetical protein
MKIYCYRFVEEFMKSYSLKRFFFGSVIVIATLFSQTTSASSPVAKTGVSPNNGVLSQLQVIYYRMGNNVAQIYIDSGASTILAPGGFNDFCYFQRKSPLIDANNVNKNHEVNEGLFLDQVEAYFVRLEKDGLQTVSRKQAQTDLHGLTKEIHSYSGVFSLKDCQKDQHKEIVNR